MKGIKLEAGSYYRTRSGKKAYVVGKDPMATHYKFVGVIAGLNEGFSWLENGSNGPGDSPHDLIVDWVEPKRIKGWFNVYENGVLSDVLIDRPAADKDAADAEHFVTRVACIKIDVLEGQGLDGSAHHG